MIADRAAGRAIDLLGVLALVGAGLIGFAHVYSDPWYLVSGTAGAALGIAAVLLARVLRGGVLGALVLLAVGYLLAGTPLALSGGHPERMLPTLDSVRTVALGSVDSWRVVVTADVPMAASGSAALPPLLLCAIATASALALLRRRHAGPAIAAASLPLIGSIALGTDQPVLPIVQGLGFGLVAVLLLALRGRAAAVPRFALVAGAAGTGGALQRAAVGGLVLFVSACVAAAALPLAPQVHRANLRDAIQPPIDVSDRSTPLALFHRYRSDERSTALFQISGLRPGAFVRLAVLDTYDGMSLGVTRTGTGSGAFPIAAIADRTDERVRILALTGVWVPTSGAGVAGVDGPGRIGVNADTQSVVAAAGVRAGQTFLVQVGAAPAPTQTSSAGATVQPGTPQAVATQLADFIGRSRSPMAQLTAMQQRFRQGYYSDGLVGQAASLPGHGAARISTLLSGRTMVGDDEQYAVAMALMADQLGYPARVVMGFAPTAASGTVTVRGGDVRALTEVLVGGSWHRFDPTPPKSRTTTNSAPKPKPKPAPQVQQPPPPLRSAEDSTPDTADHTSSKRHVATAAAAWLPLVLSVGAGGIGVLLIVLGPALLIAALRALRARRRRRARAPLDRISGGWQEVVDRAAGLGIRTTRTDTRRERAEVVDGALDVGAVQVARLADEQVFGPVEPTEEDAARFWAEVDGLVRRLDRASDRWTRLRARYGLGRVGGGRRSGQMEEDVR